MYFRRSYLLSGGIPSIASLGITSRARRPQMKSRGRSIVGELNSTFGYGTILYPNNWKEWKSLAPFHSSFLCPDRREITGNVDVRLPFEKQMDKADESNVFPYLKSFRSQLFAHNEENEEFLSCTIPNKGFYGSSRSILSSFFEIYWEILKVSTNSFNPAHNAIRNSLMLCST